MNLRQHELDQPRLAPLQVASSTVGDPYRLSPMQQGMLFHTAFEPKDVLYLQQLSWDGQGALDQASFRRAWQELVRRHPVLRTRVEWYNVDEPVQVVVAEAPIPWEQHDWRGYSSDERDERWRSLLTADRERGIDLSCAPIMRITLVRLTERTSRILWTFHHLLLDGWSLSLVLNELFSSYEAHVHGRVLNHSQPPPYRTYIAWLGAQSQAEAEKYWRRQLHGFTTPTPLPAGSGQAQTPGDATYTPRRRHTVQLTGAETATLETAAHNHRVTMGTFIHAGWALVMRQHADAPEVVFGVTVAGRPPDLPDVESMVGLFINTLPARVPFPPDRTVEEWLAAIQRDLAELRHYEYTSLPELLRLSEVPAGTPLFESIFVYASHAVEHLRVQGDHIVFTNVQSWARTNYALTAIAIPGERLELQLHTDPRRFNTVDGEEILSRWRTLLGAVAAHPTRPIADLVSLFAPNPQEKPPAPPAPSVLAHGGVSLLPDTGPRDPTEEMIARIWAEVLNVEKVGVHDNFFELGGHSLLAIQIVARLRAGPGIDLPLRSVFQAPTVAGQARQARQAGHQDRLLLPPIRPVPRNGPLPLSFAQQRLWFLDQLVPGNSFYNTSGAVELHGALNQPALERALTEILTRHEALRTTFPSVDGQPHQHIAPPGPLDLAVTTLHHLPPDRREAEARRLATEAWRRPFDLAHGPLLRAELLLLQPDRHVLMLSMHHIVGDAWSIGVVTRELGMLYDAFAHDRPSPLTEPPIQYADYATWQQHWLDSDALEAHLAYWRRQLRGSPPLLPLPTDRPRPPRQSFRGAYAEFVLPPQLSQAVGQLSRQEQVTPFMTLLAAFSILLQRSTGLNDLPIGTGVANRTHIETEGLVGCFLNMLVLRLDLSGVLTFRTLLSRVREVTLDAYAHSDVPFEKLVETLQPERSLSHMPLFQVAFGVDNTPRPTLQLAGLNHNALPFDYESVRFDLTLWIIERPTGLHAYWTYSTDLFDATTITNLHQRYETLLHNVTTNPQTPIDTLDIRTNDEKTNHASRKAAKERVRLQRLSNVSRKPIEL